MVKLGILYARCVQFRSKLVLVTIVIGTGIKISENDHMYSSFFFFFFFSFFQQYCPFSQSQIDLLTFM